MSYFIAGGCGFIGLNLAETYLKRGEKVVIFDRNPLHPAAAKAFDALPGEYIAVEGDITDREQVSDAMADHKVTGAFSGAAMTSGPDRERDFPEQVLTVNLIGLTNVLKASEANGVKRAINLSSTAAYGLGMFGETGWTEQLDEFETREKPNTLYSITKYASERVCRRLAELTDRDFRSVRLSGIYGAWEIDTGARDTLSPIMQIALVARSGGEAVLTRNDNNDWTYSRHVGEALAALMAYDGEIESDVHNITCGVPSGALDWCEKFKRAYPDFTYRLAESGEDANVTVYGDKNRLGLSPDRLANEVGHRLPGDLDAAFDDFHSWMEGNRDFWA